MLKKFDVVVIGSGPGGYITSIRASKLGKKVACIEERNLNGKYKLGGTCLNVGCIPSKALLTSSEIFEDTLNNLDIHGINVDCVKLDIIKMMRRKENIIKKIEKNIRLLFDKNKIKLFNGHGKFVKKNFNDIEIEILDDYNHSNIIATNVVIATGSKSKNLSNIFIDNKIIVDNVGALSFNKVPKRLVIIGAGAIGLELGSVWRRLGSKVTILEVSSDFLQNIDNSISLEAIRQFKLQGLNILCGVNIKSVKIIDNFVQISYLDINNNINSIVADNLIISIGRSPNIDNLGLDNIGVKIDNNNFIEVDKNLKTSVDGIYAIGDVIKGPMLAHKAEIEGVFVSEILDGQKPIINYNCIPNVIYTQPEIAWVGKTEKKLISEGYNLNIGKFPLSANSRALSMNKTDGFIKMIADSKTDEILGVHIISVNASDLISESVIAMEFKASSEDISRICYAHPSLSEIMRDVSLMINK